MTDQPPLPQRVVYVPYTPGPAAAAKLKAPHLVLVSGKTKAKEIMNRNMCLYNFSGRLSYLQGVGANKDHLCIAKEDFQFDLPPGVEDWEITNSSRFQPGVGYIAVDPLVGDITGVYILIFPVPGNLGGPDGVGWSMKRDENIRGIETVLNNANGSEFVGVSVFGIPGKENYGRLLIEPPSKRSDQYVPSEKPWAPAQTIIPIVRSGAPTFFGQLVTSESDPAYRYVVDI